MWYFVDELLEKDVHFRYLILFSFSSLSVTA